MYCKIIYTLHVSYLIHLISTHLATKIFFTRKTIVDQSTSQLGAALTQSSDQAKQDDEGKVSLINNQYGKSSQICKCFVHTKFTEQLKVKTILYLCCLDKIIIFL